MAHQSTPDVVDFACATVADLTTLPRTALSDGCRSWVSAAGATHGLWCLDDNSVALVDNLTVVATSDGVGRWIYFGFAATPAITSISVNTEALLSAVNVVAFLDGMMAWVGNPAGGLGQSQDSTWQLVTQQGGVPALAAHTCIASPTAGRVWQRLTNIETPRWSQQAAWYVDSVAGDDQNDGNTNGTALATWAEFARRMPVVIRSLTITILSNLGANDPITWTPAIRWDKAINAAIPTVTINGTATNAAPAGGANGVINAATQTVGNVPPTYTDTAGAGVTFAVDTVVRITATGAYAVVAKDEGGGTARVSPWRTIANALAAAPVNGQAYTLESWTTAPDIALSGEVFFNVTKMRVTGAWEGNSGNPSRAQSGSFTNCKFDVFAPSNSPGCGRWTWNGCAIISSSTVAVSTGSRFTFIGSLIRMPLANDWRSQHGGHLVLLDVLLQGNAGAGNTSGGLSAGSPNENSAGGLIVITGNVGIMDTGNDNALTSKRAGIIEIFGTLWGAGNLLKGTVVRDCGRVFVKTNIAPTLTSTGQELELEGAATAIPPLTAGLVVPLASALTTWAQQQAVPFSGNVLDYASGSTICTHN